VAHGFVPDPVMLIRAALQPSASKALGDPGRKLGPFLERA
jgi:hypothetical protein